MFGYYYECAHEEGVLCFMVYGFAFLDKVDYVIGTIIAEINVMEEKGRPYKILFDLRGFRSLSPAAMEAIYKVDRYLFEHSTAVRIATVTDSLLEKLEYVRLAKEVDISRMFATGRSRIFEDLAEARAWLDAADNAYLPSGVARH